MFVSSAFASVFRQSPTTRIGQNLPTGAITGQNTPESASSGTQSADDGTTGSAADPASAFQKLVKGTPEQRMFRMFLARHKLTEEQFADLSADDKKKLVEEFEKEMKAGTAAQHAPVDVTV